MLNLTTEQSMDLLYHETKYHAMKLRYKFKTLHKWWCLNCGKELFLEYNVTTCTAVFCDDVDCKLSYKTSPSVIMQQYLLRLKNEQAKLINSIVDQKQIEFI